MTFTPIPQAKDRYWREHIPAAMRNDYIKCGEQYLGKVWPAISDTLFAEFQKNGNRNHYEEQSFAMRRQMARLVMAEVMEHQGRFINDIDNGLKYFISETWWGVPAHYPTSHPERDNQVVDLFNAETAGLQAWTIYMLHDELERTDRGICKKMRKEIDRRMLTPARTTDYDWKRRTTNWNPWICENWLSCVLLCEKNNKRQQDAIQQIQQCLHIFYDNYPADGGCDEGVSYWSHAAGSLLVCARLLDSATNGAVSLRHDPKLKAMGSYVHQLYIGKRKSVNFADAYENTILPINIAFPYGAYAGDETLMGYAAYYAQCHQFDKTPSRLFDWSLSRELMFLAQYDTFKDIKPQEPLSRDTWLPSLQVFTARDAEASAHGLFVAAKGGHNGESHNHNDVGNFVVYHNAEPLIIDIGADTYTAQTFSDRRYELYNCRSAYHNVPLINGVEQCDGATYRATNTTYHRNERQVEFCLDLESAYPAAASVNKWSRTILFRRKEGIRITEDYQLSQYCQPSEIIFVCPRKPLLKKAGTIQLTSGSQPYTLQYNAQQLSPIIERISQKDLYRIRLVIRSQALNGQINYSILPASEAENK